MEGLPNGEKFLKICLFVLTQCTNRQTDRRDSDRRTDRRTDRHRMTAKIEHQ